MSSRHDDERRERQLSEPEDGARYSGEADGEASIPVTEERLNVEKRPIELGAATVHKTVTEEEQTVPVELEREEVRVERRDAGERAVQPGERVFQEDTIRVPVRGEEAVVTKEAVVTGEVVLNKERTTERQEVRDTVRKERVEADDDYARHQDSFRQHFTGRQGQRTGTQRANRTWEEAEPNYQYGYQAGRDTRYQGREFEDIEADLRRDYEERYRATGSGASAGGYRDTGSAGMGATGSGASAGDYRDTGSAGMGATGSGASAGDYRDTGSAGMGATGSGASAGDYREPVGVDDEWQHLREEIREGWDRSRSR